MKDLPATEENHNFEMGGSQVWNTSDEHSL